jgi:hypothetical protein
MSSLQPSKNDALELMEMEGFEHPGEDMP